MNNEKEFSIRETVNRNIEKVQFPAFNQHNTLLGWCSMNYPRVLQNPQYMPKPKPKVYDDNLDNLYQVRAKEKQNVQLIKPFTNFKLTQEALHQEGVGVPPPGFKKSLKQLTTAKPESKAQIYEQTYKDYEEFLNIKPLISEFPQPPNQNFSRSIRQVGEVHYDPSYENEEIRHLKKLPNSIITEQNLMTILNPTLKYLNLHNHTWIRLEQISKIGYFAANLEELILSNLDINDEILIELSRSCKNLKRIDVSECQKLTERGIRQALDQMVSTIQGFKCAHNSSSVSDYSLEPLQYAKMLKSIDVSFCNNLTASFTKSIIASGAKLSELRVATVENLQSDLLAELVAKSKTDLERIDFSFIATKDINDSVLGAVASCNSLKELILTGCSIINDSALRQLAGLPNLRILKLGGLQNVSDSTIVTIAQQSPYITRLELNNMPRLTENGVESILKALPHLEILNINYVTISDEALKAMRQNYPKVNIINHKQLTNPKDDGLRMPLPLESVVMQRPKPKKKKK